MCTLIPLGLNLKDDIICAFFCNKERNKQRNLEAKFSREVICPDPNVLVRN